MVQDKCTQNELMPRGFLEGHFLVATPFMRDIRFRQSVIFIYSHSLTEGAVGFIINKPLEGVNLGDILLQMGIEPDKKACKTCVYLGGPVDTRKGFLLQSNLIKRKIKCSASDEQDDCGDPPEADFETDTWVSGILSRVLNQKKAKIFIALGYAGWAGGQLEAELQQNGWLHCPADPDILFDKDPSCRWEKVLKKIGLKPHCLSVQVAHS